MATGVIKKLGKVEDGNTVSDYDKMEIEKDIQLILPSFQLNGKTARSIL